MKKKLLGILFVLGLLLALPSVVSFAETASGTCGAQGNEANVTWELDDEGTFTIRGGGLMKGLEVWDDYKSSIKTVKIEYGVTNVGDYAFSDCANLTSVTLPSSVTQIGWCVFRNCTSLTSVTIPSSVKSIGLSAFASCTSLKSITIPNSVTFIDNYVFENCWSLTSLTIPSSVTYVGKGALFCSSSTIYVPNGLDVSLASIPSTVTKLYYTAGAAESNFTPVTIDSVTYGTDKGNSITLPCDIMGNGYVIQSAGEDTGVTINHKSSEVYTLEGSEIYTPVTGGNLAAKCICSGVVTIPGPVDPYANLVISETVTVNGAKLPVTAISGGYTESGYTTVTVPKDVKYINKGAFYTNENLDTIYLPEGCQMESESVPLTTKIVYYKVNKDERGNAVVRTSSTGEEITQVTVSGADVLNPDRVLNLNNIYGKCEFTAIADNALDNSGKNLHTIILPNSVESINAEVFGNCKNLETIYLKEGCTIENEEKIADKNLIYYTDDGATISSAKINIDNFPLELSKINNRCNITTIGENAFKDQVKMKSVTIPATVTSIGTNPFAGCTSLKAITVDGDNGLYKSDNGVLLSDNGTTLVCCPEGFADSTYTTSESVTAIAAQAFADCKNLENVVLRETVTSVGADAFTGCDKLMAVYTKKDCDIDSTVLNSENIIYYMVIGLVSPKEVTIGKTTEDYSYKLEGGQNCIINRAGTELDLTVLNNTGLYKITCIGTTAFYQEASKQNNLKSIIIPEGVTEVKGGFLRYSQGLESVKLPTTLTGELPQHGITDNKALKILTIPHGVTGINTDAFEATTDLETVYVPSTITYITPITNNSTEANIIYYHTPTKDEKGRYESTSTEGNEVCIGKYEFGIVGDNNKYLESRDSSIINRDNSVIDLRTMDSNYQIKLICMAAFSRNGDTGKEGYIEKIIVPEGVIHIDQGAFRCNSALSSITLPTTLNNPTTMQKYSITDNGTLETLVIPHGVTQMHQYALYKVTNLTRVYVPDVENFNVTYITNYSKDATIIRYEVTDGTVSPKKVKITDATLPNGSSPSSMEVYCDEMGDRYVITEVDEGARDKVALKHKGDVEVPAKEVSCTEGGNETYWKCLCGANKYTEKGSTTEAIAVGHTNLSEVPAKAATFHACGIKAHYVCEKCKKLFEDKDATTSTTLEDLVIPEHKGHDFGAYSHDYENQALHADVCALKGTVAATCAICDQTDVKACAEHTKSSHVWEEKITPATCTTEGKAEYTCSLCDVPETETKTLEIDPNNHTKEHITEVAATCIEAGNNEYWHCEVCDKYFKNEECTQETSKEAETIKALGHTKEHITEVAATCTEAGNDEYWYCSGCKKYFKDEACTTVITDISEVTRPATGHTNVEKTEAKAATCTEAGNDEYWYCGGCKKYFEDEACTTVITDISEVTRPATGHKPKEMQAKEATCTEAGNKACWQCETCDKYFADAACENEITKDDVIIPAGHDFESSTKYSYNSTQHWKKCSRCDEEDVNNKKEHTYGSGENTNKCDVCGYVTTPDTYKVSGTVSIWDNTVGNTTRVRLYDKDAEEKDIKSDIQDDTTGESDTKIYQYDANEIGTPEESTSNRYTQSFEFTGVANGEYKLAAWRPAYDISNKHYAYTVRITDVTVNGEDVAVNGDATKLWLYGDVNGDGKIDAGDATNILAYVIGKSSSIDEDNKAIGDVNDDGNVDAGDATNVLAYIIGKSSILDDKK